MRPLNLARICVFPGLLLAICGAAWAEPAKPVLLDGTWRFSPIDDSRSSQPDWNDGAWLEVLAPKPLKEQNSQIKSGNGWYRRKFELDQALKGSDLILVPGAVQGNCVVFFNGTLVGRSPFRGNRYLVPASLVRSPGTNVLAIRVASTDGIQGGKIELLPADEKTRRELLLEYARSFVRLDVRVPPLAPPQTQTVPLKMTVENPASFNPLTDNAKAELLLRRSESEPTSTVALRLVPGQAQAFEFPVPVAESDWKIVLRFDDQEAQSVSFRLLNCLQVADRLAVDPHSRWVKDAKGGLVTLFAGQSPDRPKVVLDRKQPRVLNLTNALLWDDYYLPNRQGGHFVEQYARLLHAEAEVVDAAFQGLPLLLLPELRRLVASAQPDVVVVSMGEHEHYFSPSHAESAQAFDAILAALQAFTTARIILVTPPPSLTDRAISAPYEAATKQLAAKYGLPVIDSAAVFDAKTGQLEELYDRHCPNEAAHALIAAELLKVLPKKDIKKLLKREEYAAPAAEDPGKTLTLIDGRMPATPDLPRNVQWGKAAEKAAHWHQGGAKQSEHSFTNGDPLRIPAGSTLLQEALLEAEPRPKSIMLVFRSCELNREAQGINYFHQHSEAHGVFWGEDVISYSQGKTGTPARVNGGQLPESGKWTTLSMDTAAVGLAGRHLDSIRFVTYDGTTRWGRTLLRTAAGETVWIDGSFPLTGGRGRIWQWVAAPGRPGERAHRSIDISAERVYSFNFAKPVPLAAGARLRQWVWLPPGQEPSRIALSPDGRTPRYYWGRHQAYDDPGRAWVWAGPMPLSGQWTKLEVPLGARLDGIGFLTWSGAALWGKTEIVGCDPKFELGEDFYYDYKTSQQPDPAAIGTNMMGNQFFLGQTPRFCISVNNPSPEARRFDGQLALADASGGPLPPQKVQCELPAESIGTAEVALPNLPKGFYRVALQDTAGAELAATTLSILPNHVNLGKKELFVYSNSGYVPEELRFYDVLGGKWSRYIATEQEMFRIESFDTSPINTGADGTDPVLEGYRLARKGAEQTRSTPHHTQYWFNISSDEMNLKWHNMERWSEVIRGVTIGLKQADPNCIVSTPEINSIAMGHLEKLGENHTFDYLDLYFTTGCSLPVPPECMNKYWAFDIDALALIEERFGRRLTLTGMQYSTGNVGRAWGIHEEHQAAYYVRGDVLRRTRDVDYISYFKFRESPNVNIYEVKDAITHVDHTPKPAFVALVNNFTKMDRSRYLGQLFLGAGNHAYLFDRPNGPILALWTTEPVPQKVYLNLRAPKVTVTDLFGREEVVPTTGGLLAFKITGDVQYIEGFGGEITEETHFQPAPVLDARDFAKRKLKEIFIAAEADRQDGLNFGDSRRGGRGDLVETAGATFPLRVNVYNLSPRPANVEVSLSLPGGFEDRTGKQKCALAPGTAASHWFTVHIPVGRKPGLDKIRALAAADGQALDPFTTDILVRSPLEILPLEAPPRPGTPIRVRFTNATDAPADARVRLSLPHGWQTDKPENALSKVAPGQAAESAFVLTQAPARPFHDYSAAAFAQVGNQEAELQAALDFAVVQPAEQPVMLDGQLDEWFAATPLDYGQRSNDYIYNTLAQILDPLNFSLRLRTLYDQENLYVALDGWDDSLCEEDTKHGLLWDLDSVQISFDVDSDGKTDEMVSVSCTGRSYIEPKDPRGDREPMITGTKGLVDVASRVFLEPTASHPRGSVMELAIPWSWFQAKPFAPKPGAKLGIHVFCVDEDVRGWSARPWKFDQGRTPVFLPFTLGTPVQGVTPNNWSPRPRIVRKRFSRSPGDVAAFEVAEAGLVRGQYWAGNAERFPTTGLDVADRAQAQRLWFYGPGFVEYEHDLAGWQVSGKVRSVEFVAELASCYRPGNTHYALPGNPTRVQVSIGGLEIGHYDVLGDPGVDGWLMRLRVEESGTFHRDRRVSTTALDALLPLMKGKVRVRLTASGLGGNPGGLNVHGPNGSGIHGLDPSLIVSYEP